MDSLDPSPIQRACPDCGKPFNPRWYEPAQKYARFCGTCAMQNLDKFLSEEQPDDAIQNRGEQS